jgi:hypothetical protein
MRKARVGLLVAAISMAVLMFAATALATYPKTNEKFTGTSTKDDKIVARTGDSKKSLKSIKVTEDCGSQYEFEDVKINRDGEFKAVYKFDATVVFKITGTWKSKTRATGNIEGVTCSGARRGYTITN